LRTKREASIINAFSEQGLSTRWVKLSVKVYDKFGIVLRIEVASNDISKMNVFHEIQKKDGSRVNEWADATKSIYSPFILTATFRAVVNRYLD
jgi:hypothetical protein